MVHYLDGSSGRWSIHTCIVWCLQCLGDYVYVLFFLIDAMQPKIGLDSFVEAFEFGFELG